MSPYDINSVSANQVARMSSRDVVPDSTNQVALIQIIQIKYILFQNLSIPNWLSYSPSW